MSNASPFGDDRPLGHPLSPVVSDLNFGGLFGELVSIIGPACEKKALAVCLMALLVAVVDVVLVGHHLLASSFSRPCLLASSTSGKTRLHLMAFFLEQQCCTYAVCADFD